MPPVRRRLSYQARGQVYLWEVDDTEQADAVKPGKAKSHPKTAKAFKPKLPNKQKPAELRERRAAGALRLAKLLIRKRPKAAKQRLQEIVNEFPGTKAAKQAAALLKK